ncbi:MAG TPA: hypothetical protein VFM70_10625 [Salinimicrobium sp.]|nr:hypothetical protein [Salinimicrobium sp.]
MKAATQPSQAQIDMQSEIQRTQKIISERYTDLTDRQLMEMKAHYTIRNNQQLQGIKGILSFFMWFTIISTGIAILIVLSQTN